VEEYIMKLLRQMFAVLLLLPVLALAHHGWSEYQGDKLIKLTGKIVSTGYENPHGTMQLEADGKTWLCVLAPPFRMETRGLAKDALKPGIQASVEGYAHRTKGTEMRAERIIIGGKTIELR